MRITDNNPHLRSVSREGIMKIDEELEKARQERQIWKQRKQAKKSK
jgi:hypothetical protein